MKTLHIQSVIAAAFAAVIAIAAPAGAQQAAAPAVAIDNDDIGGVVRSASGPEAGVWVIAETRDLPVRYIKSVVTDDQGRYVIPDLPKANYDIWVRGYGLVDSPKVKSEPGKQLNLTAVLAPNEAEAAKYYPAIYWYAMMKIPEAEVFGSKDAPAEHQDHRLSQRHEEQRLRRLPPARPALDPHDSRNSIWTRCKTHEEAWVRRIQSGQAGENMVDHRRRSARRRAVQVSRRLDRAGGQGRAAVCQADAAAGRRAQHRRHAARLAQSTSNICTT